MKKTKEAAIAAEVTDVERKRNILVKRVLVIILTLFCVLALGFDNSAARRKKSFLGEMFDAVKEGASRVKCWSKLDAYFWPKYEENLSATPNRYV